MRTEPELLNERLDRLAIVLDEIMPNCALLVRDAIDLLKEQEAEISRVSNEYLVLVGKVSKQPQIVRCKDCAYALFKEGVVEHGYIFCTKPFTERWQAVKPNNWFCADGVVKDNCSEFLNSSVGS